MAAITETKSFSVVMKLNNGTTTTGAVKTLSVNLGSLNKTAFDANKVLNVVNALAPCFFRMLYIVEKIEVSQLSEE